MRKLKSALTIHLPTRVSSAILMMLTAMLVFSMPMAGSAQTLRGTDFVTESGDHTMAWSENWTASLIAEDEFSTMVMLEGQISIYAVMFIHDEDLGLSNRAIYASLSGVLVNQFDAPPTLSIEWEEDDGSYRGAHILQLSGIDFALYLRVDSATVGTGPTMQFAAAPIQAFPVSLQAMQEELTVDGAVVFAGDNGEDVTARLDAELSKTESSGPVSDADVSEEAAPESPASETDHPLSDRSRLQRNAPISAPESSESTDGTYISSENDFTITYPATWIDMAATDTTIGEFSLVSDSGRSVISFSGRSTTETNRQAFFEDIVARESRYQGYVGSVIREDRLLIATWINDNELAVLEYIFIDDSTVVTVMLTITSGNPERYAPDAQAIEINGEPILRDWEEVWPGD